MNLLALYRKRQVHPQGLSRFDSLRLQIKFVAHVDMGVHFVAVFQAAERIVKIRALVGVAGMAHLIPIPHFRVLVEQIANCTAEKHFFSADKCPLQLVLDDETFQLFCLEIRHSFPDLCQNLILGQYIAGFQVLQIFQFQNQAGPVSLRQIRQRQPVLNHGTGSVEIPGPFHFQNVFRQRNCLILQITVIDVVLFFHFPLSYIHFKNCIA